MVAVEQPSHESIAVSNIESEDQQRFMHRRLDHLPSGYLGLRHIALSKGVGAIERDRPLFGGEPSEPSSPVTARQLLDELLPAPQRPNS